MRSFTPTFMNHVVSVFASLGKNTKKAINIGRMRFTASPTQPQTMSSVLPTPTLSIYPKDTPSIINTAPITVNAKMLPK